MNEQQKYHVIKKLVDTGGNKRRAAMTLGITERQINRMIKGYKENGKAFFVHGNRGRKPATTIPSNIKENVVKLYTEKYHDANFTHFTYLLKEYEDISISVSSVRNILEAEYILSPMVTRKKQKRVRNELKAKQKTSGAKEQVKIQKSIVAVEDAHSRQSRKSFFGEQIQMDASVYNWFADTLTHLHIAIDNCTGQLVAAYFDTQETLNGYYHLLFQILSAFGIPYGIFTDRRTVFNYKRTGSSDVALDACTQFGYACKQLGIQLDSSSVPQAKARVERMFKTLQSRLPVELRMKGVRNMNEANAFLPSYISKLNTEFALPLDGVKSVFEPAPCEDKINLTLAVLTERTVDPGHCVKWNRVYYRMLDARGEQVHYLPHTKVMLIKAFDGRLFCSVGDELVYALEEVPKFEKISAEFSIETPKPEAKRNIWIPPMDHPWKRASFNKYAKAQAHRIEMEVASY